MKKTIVLMAALYILACGYTISKTDTQLPSDIIILLEVPLAKTAFTVKPDTGAEFDKLIFSKSMSYNNANPKNATSCVMKVRLPAKYKDEFISILKSKYPKFKLLSVEAVPVPTATAMPTK